MSFLTPNIITDDLGPNLNTAGTITAGSTIRVNGTAQPTPSERYNVRVTGIIAALYIITDENGENPVRYARLTDGTVIKENPKA